MIKIITVGKKPPQEIAQAIDGYQKRLHGAFELKWVLIPNSPLPGTVGAKNESQAILRNLHISDYVILLDETGKNISSNDLAHLLIIQMETNKDIVLAIGGAYGVDESVKQRADFTWSLSKLVFPHQLVRLLLTEQIYRAQTIAAGHPYHHE
ncbi:23S rRNA (pseudouridine(1915)-N(3))-methyltransferase RlmH [Candidatus Saccharibacteria bacterium]|nr:23S rRNA (pseudouridine(1915)-N(3))-methyltransferase RlmH [Candidatus Saccharibacteria bacterium]